MQFAWQCRTVGGWPRIFRSDIRILLLGNGTAPAQQIAGRRIRIGALAVVALFHPAELGQVLLGKVVFAPSGLEELRLDRRKRGKRPAVSKIMLVLD